MDISAIVAQIDAEIAHLTSVRNLLQGEGPKSSPDPSKRGPGRPRGSVAKPGPKKNPRRKMSPEGRARIAAAQKSRWSKLQKAQRGNPKPASTSAATQIAAKAIKPIPKGTKATVKAKKGTAKVDKSTSRATKTAVKAVPPLTKVIKTVARPSSKAIPTKKPAKVVKAAPNTAPAQPEKVSVPPAINEVAGDASAE